MFTMQRTPTSSFPSEQRGNTDIIPLCSLNTCKVKVRLEESGFQRVGQGHLITQLQFHM